MNITERITKLVLARRPEIGPRGVKRAISNACGISYEAVRQWYSGDTGNIKNENLVAVAEKFDTSVDWLLSGEGEPPRRSEDRRSTNLSSVAPESAGQGQAASEPDAPVDICDDQIAELLGKLRDAKKKASPRSQAVISRMIGLAERAALDDAAWKLIDDLLTELSKK